MKRLQCIGKPSEVSSKVTETETVSIQPVSATSADPLPKESVEWKPKQPSEKTEVQDPTKTSNKTNPTLGAQSSKRPQKTKPSRKTEKQDPSRNIGTTNPTLPTQNAASGGHNAPKAPSFKNVTTHGHKVPKQVLHVMTGQRATSEEQLGCRHELQILSKSDPEPPVEQQFKEEESEENETADGHVPLELFAEFLEAVMTKNYQLAKKLCQMILIYEPQNSEAKSFLPLIEEKLLIETDDSSDNDESDTSDDDDEDSSDDEDTDANKSSDSCDTDESTDSTDDDTSSSSS